MLKIVILAVAVAAISASLEADWAVYKSKHGKNYSAVEDSLRRYVWQSNLKTIAAHNELYARGLKSYYLGENKYTDMTSAEFTKTMNGLKLTKSPEPVSEVSGRYKGILPDTVDWRKKGYVTPVKDQGQCGACWAFSATGSLEGAHFKSTGQQLLTSLSESNLVDCSQKWGNNGCEGGLMNNAFKYVIDNKGLNTENDYPYVPQDHPCKFNASDVGTTEKSFTDIKSGSEDELQKASALVGPISVGIDASHQSFQLYAGGIYEEQNCSTTKLDHGVLVVGYGSENGKDYWLVKNSWGYFWGEEGYIKMSRNKDNQCGIATSASYPTV